MANPAPPPRQVDSWQTAEQNAAAWMRYWGYSDATVTSPGPDGGIDVQAYGALAQVKFEASNVGRPAVQRLVGASNRDNKQLIFFTGAGYSATAVDFANSADVALFTYDLVGRMEAVNPAAARLAKGLLDQSPHDVVWKTVEGPVSEWWALMRLRQRFERETGMRTHKLKRSEADPLLIVADLPGESDLMVLNRWLAMNGLKAIYREDRMYIVRP